MQKVCSHFYSLLGESTSLIKSNHELRTKYSYLLLRYLESPTTLGNEILNSTTSEEDREIVLGLTKELNSVWSKDIGLHGLREYIINKLYEESEQRTEVEDRFKSIRYLMNYVNAMKGTVYAPSNETMFTSSEEFLRPSDDDTNNAKVNLVLNLLSEQKFEDAIINNNITSLFIKINKFIISLSQLPTESKLSNMLELIKNDTTFNLKANPQLVAEEFKVVDVMKQKANTDILAGTVSVLKFMEDEASADSLSALKAISNAMSGFVSKEKDIRHGINDLVMKYGAIMTLIEERYKKVYAEYAPLVRQATMDALSEGDDKGAKVNGSVHRLSEKIVRYDNYLMQLFYQAHIELLDLVMHIKHFNNIKMLMEGISKLKLNQN